jgi:hypothetical protein
VVAPPGVGHINREIILGGMEKAGGDQKEGKAQRNEN